MLREIPQLFAVLVRCDDPARIRLPFPSPVFAEFDQVTLVQNLLIGKKLAQPNNPIRIETTMEGRFNPMFKKPGQIGMNRSIRGLL